MGDEVMYVGFFPFRTFIGLHDHNIIAFVMRNRLHAFNGPGKKSFGNAADDWVWAGFFAGVPRNLLTHDAMVYSNAEVDGAS